MESIFEEDILGSVTSLRGCFTQEATWHMHLFMEILRAIRRMWNVAMWQHPRSHVQL